MSPHQERHEIGQEKIDFIANNRRSDIENCLNIGNGYLLAENDLCIYEHNPSIVSCADKSKLISFPISKVVKTLYYAHKITGDLYAIVIPATGSADVKAMAKADPRMSNADRKKLHLADSEELKKLGTPIGFCHPFIALNDHNVKGIYFDRTSLNEAKLSTVRHDFSLGMNEDGSKGLGMLINYHRAFEILSKEFQISDNSDVEVISVYDLLRVSDS